MFYRSTFGIEIGKRCFLPNTIYDTDSLITISMWMFMSCRPTFCPEIFRQEYVINIKWQMVNGSRCYWALESFSIASALSTALTIYPCQIRVHQRWQSKLRLPTARKKEWWPATADSSPHAVTSPVSTLWYSLYFSLPYNVLHAELVWKEWDV